MTETPTDVIEDEVTPTIEVSPFVRDQRSLHSPLGVILTLGMIVVAIVLCGAVLYFAVSSGHLQ
jgi:hypothetical protein